MEGGWCGGHRVDVRLQDEQGAEPHRDRLAVVVSSASIPAPASVVVSQPSDDGAHQSHVHGLVVPGGGHEDRAGRPSPVDQDGDPDQGAEPGQPAHGQRIDVIEVLADADRGGPRHRDDQADEVADDDDQKMPKWNSGEPIRSSRDSYSWLERVVQPNWS